LRASGNSSSTEHYSLNLVERYSDEIYVVGGNLVAELYAEIIQHVSHFTDRVQKTKMSM